MTLYTTSVVATIAMALTGGVCIMSRQAIRDADSYANASALIATPPAPPAWWSAGYCNMTANRCALHSCTTDDGSPATKFEELGGDIREMPGNEVDVDAPGWDMQTEASGEIVSYFFRDADSCRRFMVRVHANAEARRAAERAYLAPYQ